MVNAEHIDPIGGYDLAAYGDAVKKFIKLLIRARAKVEPEFLTADEYERWHLENIAHEPYTLEQLVNMAAAADEHLWRVFIGPEGSGGISPYDPRGNLKENVVQFSMGASISDMLVKLQRGEDIDWEQMAEWHRLAAIRDGLDRLLPQSSVRTQDEDDECPVVVANRNTREVEVFGHTKQLTLPRFHVVQTLISAYPGTLTKDQLASQSGHGDAVNILKRLVKSDADWEAVVRLAGTSGSGYGIVRPNSR